MEPGVGSLLGQGRTRAILSSYTLQILGTKVFFKKWAYWVILKSYLSKVDLSKTKQGEETNYGGVSCCRFIVRKWLTKGMICGQRPG